MSKVYATIKHYKEIEKDSSLKDESYTTIYPPIYNNHNLQLSTIHFPTAHTDQSNTQKHIIHQKLSLLRSPQLNLSSTQFNPTAIHNTTTLPTNNNLYTIQSDIQEINDINTELRDIVTPIISNDFFLRHHMKTYFKYGKFDRPPFLNIHFQHLMHSFYKNTANAVNFILDIYLVPHLKCNLYFFTQKSPMTNIYNLIDSNNGNLLEPKIKLKLCQGRKLSQIVKDNYEITHLNNKECYDFASCAYLNNKYDNYNNVAIASTEQRSAVYHYPKSFAKTYKPSKTKGFIKRLLNSQTGIQNLTLTYLLTLHVDLHQKSKIFTKKSLAQVKSIQRFAENKTRSKHRIKTDDIFLLN